MPRPSKETALEKERDRLNAVKILKALDKKGIARFAVSKATKIGYPLFWNWEQGKYSPSQKNLKKLKRFARAHGTEVN